MNLHLTGHEESYNPPVEYVPTQEELNAYELMYEEDRPKFIPKGYNILKEYNIAILKYSIVTKIFPSPGLNL